MNIRCFLSLIVAPVCVVTAVCLSPYLPETSSSCCPTVSNETVTSVYRDSSQGSMGDFYQTITGSNLLAGLLLEEFNGSTGSDSCYWSGSGLDQYPNITDSGGGGGEWSLASNDVWGADVVGWYASAIIEIRNQGPSHGVKLPCGFIVYQNMQIECNASLFINYETDNPLTGTIYPTYLVDSRTSEGGGKSITIDY